MNLSDLTRSKLFYTKMFISCQKFQKFFFTTKDLSTSNLLVVFFFAKITVFGTDMILFKHTLNELILII